MPSWLETGEIVQLTFPLASVVPEQLCAPSVNVTVWPDGLGGTEPSSRSVALTVSDEAFARMTVGPVYVRVVSSRVPPPPGVASPLLWGTESHLRDLFGEAIESLTCTERTFVFRFRSAEDFVTFFRTYYGPTLKAFEAVAPEGAEGLAADLADLASQFAGVSEGPVAIPAAWLETVAIRR